MQLIDAHTHIRDLACSHQALYTLAEKLRYDKLAVLSLQCCGDLLQNLMCATCKLAHPGTTYAFGGLDYKTGRDFVTQAQNLRQMGFDGIKMLEGKPTTRRLLNRALDDPAYDAFYTYLEDTGFPVLFHVVDPATFWDREQVPDWALANGWFYGENDAPYEQYYTEVENMLNKHPKLRAIFAHFYFLSGDPARVQAFLDNHPNVSIDVTAGVEMYEDFSKDPAFWRAFFIKNSDRIIFGTDSTDEPLPAESDQPGGKVALNGYNAMEIEFLHYAREVEVFGMKFQGLGLPDETLARIFADNYIGFVGDTPRTMDTDALRKEAALLRGFLEGEDIKRLGMIEARI